MSGNPGTDTPAHTEPVGKAPGDFSGPRGREGLRGALAAGARGERLTCDYAKRRGALLSVSIT